MTEEDYAEKVLKFLPNCDWGGGKVPPDFPPFVIGLDDLAELAWGELGKACGLNMTGKELLDGFLASEEFVSAMNGLGTVIPVLRKYKDGKLNDRQVRTKLKKYLRRTCKDAADSLDDLSEIFGQLAEAGLEPAQPYGQGILNP